MRRSFRQWLMSASHFSWSSLLQAVEASSHADLLSRHLGPGICRQSDSLPAGPRGTYCVSCAATIELRSSNTTRAEERWVIRFPFQALLPSQACSSNEYAVATIECSLSRPIQLWFHLGI